MGAASSKAAAGSQVVQGDVVQVQDAAGSWKAARVLSVAYASNTTTVSTQSGSSGSLSRSMSLSLELLDGTGTVVLDTAADRDRVNIGGKSLPAAGEIETGKQLGERKRSIIKLRRMKRLLSFGGGNSGSSHGASASKARKLQDPTGSLAPVAGELFSSEATPGGGTDTVTEAASSPPDEPVCDDADMQIVVDEPPLSQHQSPRRPPPRPLPPAYRDGGAERRPSFAQQHAVTATAAATAVPGEPCARVLRNARANSTPTQLGGSSGGASARSTSVDRGSFERDCDLDSSARHGRSSSAAAAPPPPRIHVGMAVLCLDRFHSKYTGELLYKWRPATIVHLSGTAGGARAPATAVVHYHGWGERFDVELSLRREWERLALAEWAGDADAVLTGAPLRGAAREASWSAFAADAPAAAAAARRNQQRRRARPLQLEDGARVECLDAGRWRRAVVERYEPAVARLARPARALLRFEGAPGQCVVEGEEIDALLRRRRHHHSNDGGSSGGRGGGAPVGAGTGGGRPLEECDSGGNGGGSGSTDLASSPPPPRSGPPSRLARRLERSSLDGSYASSSGGGGRPARSLSQRALLRAPQWLTADEAEDAEDPAFLDAMARRGLAVVEMEPDGNCLYRAVSDQIYGNCDNHLYVRKACVDHMSAHRARFSTFVAGDFAAYLRRARQPGVWGDDLEIRALEEVFDRPVRIYAAEDPRARPMKMDFEHALEGGGEGGAGGGGGGRRVAPITLSYHGHSHYNSVRDARLVYPLQPRQSQVLLRTRLQQHALSPGTPSPSAPSTAEEDRCSVAWPLGPWVTISAPPLCT